MRLGMSAISVRNLAKKSRSDSDERWRTVINDAVILPPRLLLENRVRKLTFSIAHEVMDRGGRFWNQLSALPFKHVQKNRHLVGSV